MKKQGYLLSDTLKEMFKQYVFVMYKIPQIQKSRFKLSLKGEHY